MSVQQLLIDRLQVEVHAGPDEVGRAAGAAAEAAICELQASRPGPVRVLFAAAPSQDATLCRLVASSTIDWNRVVGFQMDEYTGLPAGAPQLFSRYLERSLFDRVSGARFEPINASAEPVQEAARYARLVSAAPIDLCCLGIGENGHLAFNDPPEARADDAAPARVVRLAESSRRQQVRDGCFDDLARVPRWAVTLTIPTLLAARTLVCSVPGRAKRAAVAATLGRVPVERCPASAILGHPRALLFVDRGSWPGTVP